jgi:hypothetical protein
MRTYRAHLRHSRFDASYSEGLRDETSVLFMRNILNLVSSLQLRPALPRMIAVYAMHRRARVKYPPLCTSRFDLLTQECPQVKIMPAGKALTG